MWHLPRSWGFEGGAGDAGEEPAARGAVVGGPDCDARSDGCDEGAVEGPGGEGEGVGAAGLSGRAIARSLKISPVTVRRYVSRAEELGLGWPLPESLDDAELERRLFPAPAPSCSPRPLPDWTKVHRELRGKDVTLALVWEEYKDRACERNGVLS